MLDPGLSLLQSCLIPIALSRFGLLPITMLPIEHLETGWLLARHAPSTLGNPSPTTAEVDSEGASSTLGNCPLTTPDVDSEGRSLPASSDFPSSCLLCLSDPHQITHSTKYYKGPSLPASTDPPSSCLLCLSDPHQITHSSTYSALVMKILTIVMLIFFALQVYVVIHVIILIERLRKLM